MSSPPRRWRRLELQAPGGAGAFPLRCYDADDGRRWDGRLPGRSGPNYVVGLPSSPQPSRAAAPHPQQRAPLRRQKPYLGAVRTNAAAAKSGRPRDDVAASPASSGSSAAGGAGGGGDKSLSTVSLEDAISRSMSRLSDDDDVVMGSSRGRRVTALPLSDVTPRGGVARNDVTGMGRSSVVTSRRPARPLVLSSDV